MTRDTLTGSRIRERRVMLGVKQAALARQAGISAAYLNLIEHNRRRIGGKLLLDIADALEVEPSILTEGAEAALIASLREAAHDGVGVEAEVSRVDEFAGRFPGWAALLSENAKRIGALERTVVALTDRLTHDPQLAASLHEMLTTVTAVRSAASILADAREVEPEWQERFLRNINEDSGRLSEISLGLVQYLDSLDDSADEVRSPQEEVDAVLFRNGFCFDGLETGTLSVEDILKAEGQSLSTTAGKMLRSVLDRTRADIALAPGAAIVPVLQSTGPDPWAVARALGLSPALVMRRIAALAPKAGLPSVGLAVCDSSGTLIYRQPLESFPLPRFGPGCPVLPLYQALSRPMQAITMPVDPPMRVTEKILTHAFAEARGGYDPAAPPLIEAHMLVVTGPGADAATEEKRPVGVTCRVCPRDGCPGRSEPSILKGGL